MKITREKQLHKQFDCSLDAVAAAAAVAVAAGSIHATQLTLNWQQQQRS